MLYVYNADEMSEELQEKTMEEFDVIEKEMKFWRQRRSRA